MSCGLNFFWVSVHTGIFSVKIRNKKVFISEKYKNFHIVNWIVIMQSAACIWSSSLIKGTWGNQLGETNLEKPRSILFTISWQRRLLFSWLVATAKSEVRRTSHDKNRGRCTRYLYPVNRFSFCNYNGFYKLPLFIKRSLKTGIVLKLFLL